RYLERPYALPVDPVALPLGGVPKDVAAHGGLYGAFRDASPDYWGRLVLSAELKIAPEALSEMDYLLQANASRVGNLDFRATLEQGEPPMRPPAFQALGELLEAASLLQAGERISQELLRLLEQGTSVGGARPKCTVELEDTLWIAKFPARGDTVNFPRLEYATLALARACGITVPETRLVQAGGKDVLLVRRFDREKAATGYLRFGFLSALSLMEWDEWDRPAWSYPALADRMRATILAQPEQLHELFRRMVFNILCRNTDDHPRNHAFLWGEKGLALSPAYDIVPNPTRPGVGTEFSLCMALGERGREASLANALSMSPRFGLTSTQAEKVVAEMRVCAARWEEHYREHSLPEGEIESIRGCFTLAST
ncbi:MAG: HipA domain-containing protein, partial [Desulfuromonadales bacterium]|nr:HipA domain-containing protein [Desulfuromonadales bacterium]